MAEPISFIERPSPNFNERTRQVDTIILHYTAGELTSSLDHLCDPTATPARVSAHYVVARTGEIYRLVDESKRAWHAGSGSWKGQSDLNSSSVGIEIINLGRLADDTFDPYPEEQIAAVIRLCQDIRSRHKIRHVLGHSDVSLGRKQDPGEHFPWKRLAKEGVGFWTDDIPHAAKLSTRAMLEAIGYDVKDLHQATIAFQRHFYPGALNGTKHRTKERLTAVYNALVKMS